MNKYKKSIILFAAFFFVSLQAFSQNSAVDSFFSRYNREKFIFVSFDPQTSGLATAPNNSKFTSADTCLIHKSVHIQGFKSMRMLATDSSFTTNTEREQFYQEILNELLPCTVPYTSVVTVTGKYGELESKKVSTSSPTYEVMSVQNEDDNKKCFARKDSNNKVAEIIMVINDKDALTLLDITGNDLDTRGLGAIMNRQ